MEQKREPEEQSAFHIEMSAAGFFGEVGVHWDLSEEDLERDYLQKRAQGGDIWVQGKRFDWDGGQFRIFQGPPTSELEDYTPALNPSAYWMGGSLTEVTHHYVKGPPGGSVELPQETATGNAVFLVHGATSR